MRTGDFTKIKNEKWQKQQLIKPKNERKTCKHLKQDINDEIRKWNQIGYLQADN